MNNKLSVIVITKNEERNIEDCLNSVKWADEIILVDSESTDKTVEIAKRFTDKIFVEKWQGYSQTKNYAIGKASNNWILAIDADERVSPELADEIKSLLEEDEVKYSGYQVGRRAYFLGKWIKHCGWYPGYVIRFFKKGNGKYNETPVHEKFELDGKVGTLRNDLLHYTDPNLIHYFNKFNSYTSLAAENMKTQGKKFRIADIVFRPAFTFFRMYFLQRGFLDGIYGFVLCALSSFYVFSKYAKLWELKMFNFLTK